MNTKELQNHWDQIYNKKAFESASWHQANHNLSIELIKTSGLKKDIRIIDIGGGDSYFAENLLDLGYSNITILEISSVAIEKAKIRLGKKADKINWICQNVLDFETSEKYDFWHDRAVFHFLTRFQDVQKYKNIVKNALNPKGKLLLVTFSELGPNICSGLDVTQYSESSLMKLFLPELHMIRWQYHDHITPTKSKQNFIYSCFSKPERDLKSF
jgi:2-polyprenyl-3-methyl-5-hydroxy-6-metoxy-1,4-benzoquinol methylase